jgi:hypothetical protein
MKSIPSYSVLRQLIGGLFLVLIGLSRGPALAVDLDDGTEEAPALYYRSQPTYGFHKTGQSTMTLSDSGAGQCSDTYPCTPPYTLDATLKIEGERDNLSGYFLVIQGHNNKSGCQPRCGLHDRPNLQVKTDGGVRIWDYLLVYPLSYGAPYWNFGGGYPQSNLLVASDLIGATQDEVSLALYGSVWPVSGAYGRPTLFRAYGGTQGDGGPYNDGHGSVINFTPTFALEDNGEHWIAPKRFASLPIPPKNGVGTMMPCEDCAVGTPCTAGGTGALAIYLNNQWQCK